MKFFTSHAGSRARLGYPKNLLHSFLQLFLSEALLALKVTGRLVMIPLS
jgi:hypothetical protein